MTKRAFLDANIFNQIIDNAHAPTLLESLRRIDTDCDIELATSIQIIEELMATPTSDRRRRLADCVLMLCGGTA